MCVGHITYYKRANTRVNARLALLLYVCVAHTYEPNPCVCALLGDETSESGLASDITLLSLKNEVPDSIPTVVEHGHNL